LGGDRRICVSPPVAEGFLAWRDCRRLLRRMS
jgi:hypothetical protein